MDTKVLEHIQARVDADEEQQKLFKAYDDMDTLNWSPPVSLLKDWVRVSISTAPHDALKQMANIFDTHNPKWEILPLGEADADRAEELETWLEYHAAKANQAGEFSPFRKGLHNSGKFNRVIYEVDYLPYWLPPKSEWTPEQKANAQNGPFCITAHDPRCIYYEIGKYGLKWLSNVNNVSGQAVIDHWSIYEGESDEGKQIKKGLAKIKSIMDEDDEVSFIYVDYTSHEKRIVSVFKTTQEGLDGFCELDSSDAIDLLNGDNKLGFIPYAVATGDSDPLLHSMHVGGIWENQNIIDTIVDSSVMRRSWFPLIKHTSPTGEPLEIDYGGSQDVVELKQGENAEVMMPPQIDIGLQQLASRNQQRMGESAGIKNLGLQDIAGNVQFSTVQAQIQLQLTSLQPYKRTDEKALAQVALLMFRWIKFAGKGEIAYRTSKRARKDGQSKGDQVLVTPDSFDPDVMIITCELLNNTPSDKQQLVNMFTTMTQAGMKIPQSEQLERLGYQNPEQLESKWVDEQIQAFALQMYQKTEDAKLQMQIQAQTMQMQAQMQQQQMQMQMQAQQQQAMPPEQSGAMANAPQGDNIIPGGQQNNPAAGGQSPMVSAPGMTRNNVRNGQ